MSDGVDKIDWNNPDKVPENYKTLLMFSGCHIVSGHWNGKEFRDHATCGVVTHVWKWAYIRYPSM